MIMSVQGCSKLSHYRRDDAQLAKLKQMGMSSTEESKLLAMRDYIIKLANATARYGCVFYFPIDAMLIRLQLWLATGHRG